MVKSYNNRFSRGTQNQFYIPNIVSPVTKFRPFPTKLPERKFSKINVQHEQKESNTTSTSASTDIESTSISIERVDPDSIPIATAGGDDMASDLGAMMLGAFTAPFTAVLDTVNEYYNNNDDDEGKDRAVVEPGTTAGGDEEGKESMPSMSASESLFNAEDETSSVGGTTSESATASESATTSESATASESSSSLNFDNVDGSKEEELEEVDNKQSEAMERRAEQEAERELMMDDMNTNGGSSSTGCSTCFPLTSKFIASVCRAGDDTGYRYRAGNEYQTRYGHYSYQRGYNGY